MASKAEISIRVTSTRGGSTVSYTTKGRYVSFNVNGYQRTLTGQPIQPTSSEQAFWLAILNTVVADLTANPTPP